MKRTILLSLVLVLLLGCLSPIASAAGAAYVLDSGTVDKDGQVVMTLKIQNNPGLISLRCRIIYPEDALQLVSVSDAKLLNGYVEPSPTVSSPYILRWADSLATVNNTSNGTIATLTFKVIGSQPSPTVSIEHVEARTATGEKLSFAGCTATVSGPHTHVWGEWAVVTAPTCTEKGEEARACQHEGCTERETREVNALGHSYSNGSCTRCGAADPNAVPADAPKFVVSQATGHAGGTVDVTVSVENNPGIVAAYLDISYDRSKLKLTGVTNGTVMDDSSFSTTYDVSPYCLNWDESAKSGNNTNNGVMATMTFQIADGCADGTIPITLAYDPGNVYDTNLDNVTFAVQNGEVQVVSYLLGDVNDDSVINGKDVTQLRRYVGKWPNITIMNAAADVVADGVINGKDVTLLRRYVGKWPGIVLGQQSSAASTYALVPQAAPGTPTFSVSSESAAPGESVTITVSVADNPGIVAAYLDISYDIDKLTLTNVTNGTVMSDSSFSTALNVSPYCLNWDESSKPGNNTNNGVLATMTFLISEDCPAGTLPITLTYDPGNVYDTNLDNVTFDVENGSITVSGGSVCEHVFTTKASDQKATDATCTEAATYYVQCDKCDVVSDTVTVAVGNPLGHKYETKYDGTGHWSECSRCSDIKDRAAHSFNVLDCETATPCTGCDYVKPAGQHSYGEYVQTKAPTCTAAGEETRTCTVCSHPDTRVINALGHEFGEWTVVTAPTCTEKGEEARICQHEGCTERETREIKALGHEFGEWTVITAPTCTEKGEEARTCQHEGCTERETREVKALGHEFGEWTLVKAPTCTEKGEEARTCQHEGCTERETRETNALGHEFGEWAVVTAPTCTEKGEEARTCQHTGCTERETREINALGHEFGEWTVVTAPTCTEKGEEARTCQHEGCTERETREVNALGHEFGEWTVVTAPTCTEKGEEARTCQHEGCTEHETREVNALGHEFGEWTVVTAPTCTEKGEEARACQHEGCTERETRELKALGHTAGQPVRENEVPATTNKEGHYDEVVYCTSCNTELSRVTKIIPKLDGDDPILPILPIIGKPGTAPTFPFRDVPASAWYYDAVKSAWKADLIDGVTSTQFRPDENMTVAQAIKLASALHQMTHDGKVTLKNGFPNWYSTYVSYAIDNGLIESRYGDYTAVQMNSPVTRAEFVHIFHAAVDDLRERNAVADNAIPDVKTGDAVAAEIYDFYRAGILTGSDANGTFHPAACIKRSEVAAILIRMYDSSVRKTIKLG